MRSQTWLGSVGLTIFFVIVKSLAVNGYQGTDIGAIDINKQSTSLASYKPDIHIEKGTSKLKTNDAFNRRAGTSKVDIEIGLLAPKSDNEESNLSEQHSKLRITKALYAAKLTNTTSPGSYNSSNHINDSRHHHFVNKIKDARHRRRRHRQQRHRHYRRNHSVTPLGADGKQLNVEQLPQFQSFKSMIEKQQIQQQQQQQLQNPYDQTSASLTALESIVEEVARAGQQLIGNGVQVLNPNAVNNNTSTSTTLSSQQTQMFSTINNQRQQNQSHTSDLMIVDSSATPPIVQIVKSTPSPMSSTQTLRQQQPQTTIQSQNENNHQSGVMMMQPPVSHQPSHPLRIGNGNGNSLNSRGFFLTSILSKLMNVLNVTEFAMEMRDGISSRASCMACNAVVGLFLSPLYSKEVFSAAIRTVCTSFKIQSPRVCAGLAESFQDDLDYIRKNTKLSRDEICGVVFGIDCARRPTYNLFWTVPIPQYPNKQMLDNRPLSDLGTPLNEGSLINMEDAPDMFEYRRSNQQFSAMPDNNGDRHTRDTLASISGHRNNNNNNNPYSMLSANGTMKPPNSLNTNGDINLNSHYNDSNNNNNDSNNNSNSKNNANNREKSGKMLKRPQYIFDDRHQATTSSFNGARTPNFEHYGGLDQNINNANDPNFNSKNKFSSFVQITDIHIDPYYETGSLSDCKEPLCCRASSGHVGHNDKRRQAGAWGDYGNCDLPVRTLKSALNRIRDQHPNVEYWLWTGDVSPHDIWNITKEEAASDVRLVTKMIREYSNGLPVFPVIGNHEAHPVNSFSPPEIKGRFSMSWLYDLLADEWSQWLPKDALETIRIGGYYKLLVRRGFRIIALNTNYCARLNPWSFYDPVDPANQLKWLVDELLEAELNGDKVHIIGHVPPDNRECTQAWLFNFINIVDRFRNTIEAQFYGHTHRDEFRVMYSLKGNGNTNNNHHNSQQSPSMSFASGDPVGVQFIGPSLTPFTENNPAYRVYHQDQFGRLVDAETYFFNLTEANKKPNSEPRWQFSYAAQEHLNMTSGLRANDWHQYVQKLIDDEQLFDSFFRNFYRHSDTKSGQVCRYKCKHQILSDLVLSHPYKTKPKPFLANRKTSNHNHHQHHYPSSSSLHNHIQNKRLRYAEQRI